MQGLFQGEDGDDEDQAQLHFALGRAFEHNKDYTAAFNITQPATGGGEKPSPSTSEPSKTRHAACANASTLPFLPPDRGRYPDPSPIFIVGLPRSGSTLVEQILASHSSVEGTFELPNLLTIVREFDHADTAHDAYPEIVRAASPERLGVLGRRYIQETAPLKGARPYFIDKMPNTPKRASAEGGGDVPLPRSLARPGRRIRCRVGIRPPVSRFESRLG